MITNCRSSFRKHMFQKFFVWESSIIYVFYEEKVASKCPNRIQDFQILLCYNKRKNPSSTVNRQMWFCGIILIHPPICRWFKQLMLPKGLQLNLETMKNLSSWCQENNTPHFGAEHDTRIQLQHQRTSNIWESNCPSAKPKFDWNS